MQTSVDALPPIYSTENLDVLIVGAGLSGVAAAYHLKTGSPGKKFAILEGRDAIGGTWDLFRYPGIRSDSDMHTLGYSFNPWPSDKSISGGGLIREYVRDTAKKFGIDRTIRYHHRVVNASWSSAEGRWTVEALVGPEQRRSFFTCSFLFMCSGYYNYQQGYLPEWAGTDEFRGRVVHPQFWPEDLDYAGKRVVIIGSGATAVTLAPEMSALAAHVTMLQRSPTYIVSRPSVDPVAKALQGKVPNSVVGPIVRWKNVLLGMFFFNYARKQPSRFKKRILDMVKDHLGEEYDIATHFTPTYNPWDQRLCLVPDGDLFKSIRQGKVEVVTDHIDRFDATGLKLRSGKHLDADVIVTATGLQIQLMGGMKVHVDGETVDLGKTLNYKGMMYSGVPNLASAFGYTNASWTLKCELTSKYVSRLINYLGENGFDFCTPVRDPDMSEEPALNFTSGYVQRAVGVLPQQGSKSPWKLYQNYLLDLTSLKYGKVVDGAMVFSKVDRTTHVAHAVEALATI